MSILTALAEIGRIFSQKASQKAASNGLNKISEAFSVGSPMQREATYSIDITVDHPAAGAFEYGSGIHATKKEKKKYRIPKKGGAAFVAFGKDKWAGHTPPKGMDYFFFTSVQHPGVEKRPFLVPTINDTKEEFKKILGQGFKAEILSGVNKIEVIEVK
jgi:hypothetical protein